MHCSIITLSINNLNSLLKRHDITYWTRKKVPFFPVSKRTHFAISGRYHLRQKDSKKYCKHTQLRGKAGVTNYSDVWQNRLQNKPSQKRWVEWFCAHYQGKNTPRGYFNSKYLLNIHKYFWFLHKIIARPKLTHWFQHSVSRWIQCPVLTNRWPRQNLNRETLEFRLYINQIDLKDTLGHSTKYKSIHFSFCRPVKFTVQCSPTLTTF